MLNSVTIKEVKLKIGEWCKQKRQSHGITQEDLARALDMSRITIVKVESGKNVTIDNLLKIAHHFDGLQTIYDLIHQNIQVNTTKSLY
ncbi:helix-turn-helix transcriptional regulator [Flavobacterium sp. SUN046]|uniref:helix-turn-helix domain-containing protein n=1 Tax=Flavobacterium sp. SUN046 TaxID=3002440 RepID=UPI002DB625FB|nr:helix-turn-helix transcriptional regulator [Flavobacterium sp. SUN046]MEC4049326.1 helix-turn-helix transcriptional regulator [Flavobacterium sp. SUN046]